MAATITHSVKISPATGSNVHLCLASLPVLAMLIYFLFLALKRPSLVEYHLAELGDDDGIIQQALDAEGPQIPILHMLYVFLALFVMWSTLAAYLTWFVPRRRDLIFRYHEMGRVVLGDVVHVPRGRLRKVMTCNRSFAPEYARLSYLHPEDVDKGSGSERRIVTKTVRTYHPYTRESVSVLVLSNLPRSGQPKDDIDADFASFDGKPTNHGIMCIIWSWMIFLVLGSIFLVCMMSMLDDPSEPADLGFFLWGLTIFVASPLIAAVGNLLRWWMYSRWMMTAKVVKEAEHVAKTREQTEDEFKDEQDVELDGGICMGAVCGDDISISGAPYQSIT